MDNNDLKSGVIIDPRLPEKKALDYQADDLNLAGSVLLNWREKAPSEWRKYTPREQSSSLSCVAQSAAKAMEIFNYPVISAHPQYRRRANFPSGGAWPQNIAQLLKNVGTTTELLDQSQNQNEASLNRDITVPTPTKIGGYVFSNHKDIDSVAEAVELHGHCMLLIRCNKSEWTAIPEYKGDVINFSHEVCAVDYFLKDGVEYILVEDSTGHFSSFDKNGQRLISADFLIARCDNAMSLTPLPPNPVFTFTKTLKLGSIGIEVRMLQLKLGIGADGLFGKKTRAAVIAWQTKHQLQPDGIIGKFSRAVLNL